MEPVKVYQPVVKVTLFKTIHRKKLASARFQGIEQEIDLTPFLGEGGGVRTTKSVREPAGAFSVTLADKAYKGGLGFESLYGLVEPMDFIEIRMRHGVGIGKPPIVMRGFVSEVQRNEGIDGSGRPARAVMLIGQDYGKLWQMMQLRYWPGYVVGQDVLSNFQLFERFGVGFKTTQKASDFVKEFVTKIVNPYLKKLMPENGPNPSEIKLDDVVVKHGTTSLSGSQNQEGTFYEILRIYGDVGVWNELFLEDREDGVYCVYRPNPAKKVNGEKVDSDGPDVEVIAVPALDVMAVSVSRTDADVANYFWVRGPRFELVSDIYQRQASAAGDKNTILLDDYDNTKSALYGTRLMESQTQQGGDDVSTFDSGQDEGSKTKRDTSVANWINDRRKLMVEQNKDNVILERGTMRLRGNENIRAGKFISVNRGGLVSEYYVTMVAHDFTPFQGFTTSVTLERGMGFVARAKREGGADSPYLAELSSK